MSRVICRVKAKAKQGMGWDGMGRVDGCPGKDQKSRGKSMGKQARPKSKQRCVGWVGDG